MEYISYLFQADVRPTLLFYTVLTLAVFALGSLSQKKDLAGKQVSFQWTWFCAAFVLLTAVGMFCNVGTDYPNYTDIYGNNTWALVWDDNERHIEFGFRLLCYGMRFVIPSVDLGLGLIKAATLVMVFYAVYLLKEQIHVGTALGAYTALHFFTGFSAMRMNFASAMVLLAWAYLLLGKDKKTLFWLVLSMTMHRTTILCLAIYGFYWLTRKVQTKKILIFIAVLAVPMLIFGYDLLKIIVKYGMFRKYRSYVQGEPDFGVMQFVYYAPVAAVLVMSRWKNDVKSHNFLPTMAALGFVVAMMGYMADMVTRLNDYFTLVFVYLIPMFIHQVRLKDMEQPSECQLMVKKAYPLTFFQTMVIVFLYFGMRFVLEIGHFMEPSTLYPYTTWLF